MFRVHFPTLTVEERHQVKSVLHGASFTFTELGQDVKKRNKKLFDENVAEARASKVLRLDAVSSLHFAAQLKDVVSCDLLEKLVNRALRCDDEAQKIVERVEAFKAQLCRGDSSTGKACRVKGESGDESS